MESVFKKIIHIYSYTGLVSLIYISIVVSIRIQSNGFKTKRDPGKVEKVLCYRNIRCLAWHNAVQSLKYLVYIFFSIQDL